MYPTRYQLPALTAHVLAALERRREGLGEWDQAAEGKLTEEATAALREAGRQFAELADDRPYWAQVERTVLTVALPRYLRLAQAQQRLERTGYGAWRGGDLLSRVTYAAVGLLAAVLIWRTAIPDWLEPLPVAFFVGGPLLPELQAWLAKRRYARRLRQVVEDMHDEAVARDQYRPLTDGQLGALEAPQEPSATTQGPPPKQRSR